MSQLRKLLSSLTQRQRISIALAAVAVAAGLFALARWNRERNFKPLFTSLSAEDAGAVVTRLRESGVEYRLDESGGTVRVPASQVAETRLAMATAGLPKSGRIGFELFDKTNFGASDFAEQVNYRRALEGELERSIMALSEVETARVHVTLPKDSVFLESRQDGKASVMLRLRPGARLSPASVSGICHLVASAAEGLAPEAVAVLDMNGRLLARPRHAAAEDGSEPSEANLDYRQKLERDLVLKVNSALEPLLGAGKFRAGASVDVDFSRGEQSEEIYDPTRAVMLTSQKSEDISGTAGAGGVPGTSSNLPRPPARAAAGGGGVTRRTENISYQAGKTVRHTLVAAGMVKRMSLAVLLDQEVQWEGSGPAARRVLNPPTPEKIKVIRDLVAAATGFSADRGDQLIVETLPFDSTLRQEPPEGPRQPPAPSPPAGPSWLTRFPPAVWIGLAAALVLLAAGAVVLWMLRKKRRGKAAVRLQPVLPARSELPAEALEEGESEFAEKLASHAAAQQKLEAEALKALKLPAPQTKKGEVLAKHLREAATKDPAATAQLLRAWIHEEGARV
ncbi:MAG: flagellar M-ring protein FliF [Bryobacterales bacterium]|nr:flagellar M-ring protein FliF [Bryobacterales bacterium]